MVQALPPVPTVALSTSCHNSYACAIALAISSNSFLAPAGQVIPYVISSSLVQDKVATDSGTGLAVLWTCRCGDSSGPSGGNGNGDGNGGDGDDDGGCDDDGSGGGGGGGGDDGCFGGNYYSLRA